MQGPKRDKNLRITIKAVAAVLINILLLYGLAWAGTDIEIPEELGIVKESYVSKHNPSELIIHIQDAHANIQAQENEARLIKHLKDRYKLNLVCVEGGFGDFDAGFFRSFPKDKNIRDKIARYFLTKAFISGPDYLLITEDSPPAVFGAEDKELYKAQLNSFRQNQEIRVSFNRTLSAIEEVLEALKNRYYSSELKWLDSKITDFRQARISLEEYLFYLNVSSIIHNSDISEFPNLYGLIKIKELEENLDFEKAEAERQVLINSLTRSLFKKELEGLVKNSLDFKESRVSCGRYYSYLKGLAEKVGIRPDVFSNLSLYTQYITLSENLNNAEVFAEIEGFSTALKEKLIRSPAQREIDSFQRKIEILKGLSKIDLSPQEYKFFKEKREEFKRERLAQFLKTYADSYSAISLPADEQIAALEKFYDLALDRNQAIVLNSLSRLKRESGLNSAILVAGGFHTPGITSILKDKDISYLVIAPNIKAAQDRENLYFSLLKDKRLSLEEVLNDPDTLQLVSSISDPKTRQLLITYWVARATRYYSLEEIKAQLNELNLSGNGHEAVEIALIEISPKETKTKQVEHGVIPKREVAKQETASLQTKVSSELTYAQQLAELFRSKYSDEQIQPQALRILQTALDNEGLSNVAEDVRIKTLKVARRLYLRPDSKSKEMAEMYGLTRDELLDIYRLLKKSKSLQRVIVEETFDTSATGFVEYNLKHLLKYGNRLEKIFANQVVYPVVVEWHPGETCDSNCIFCYSKGLNYKDERTGNKGRTLLSIQRSKELLREFAENNVREFWVSGGKEPLTNPITADVIKYAVDLGLETRLYTNGIRMNRYVQERILGCRQIRISLNAATPETYKQVQGINGENFNRVVQNIGDLVKLKKERGASVNIGMSFVLNPFNYQEIVKIADLASSLGVDFLAIRAEQIGTVRKFNAEEIEEVLKSVDVLRINKDSGLYGSMEMDIRSLTREDLVSEKHYYPNLEKAKTCQVRTLKIGMSPYGVVYMCEYCEHPRNAKPELEIGDASKMSFREILQRSNEIKHDPAKCEACMINEYGLNIGLEKLKEDRDFGISLEDQPYVVIKEQEQPRQLRPVRNTAVANWNSEISNGARIGVEDKAVLTEVAQDEFSLITAEPFAKQILTQDFGGSIILSPQAISAINALSSAYDGLTLEIDVDTLIDTSGGAAQLKGLGFKEAMAAFNEAYRNKEIAQRLNVRLINTNPHLDKIKIIKVLGLSEELLSGFVDIIDVPLDYITGGIEPYLIKGSIRVVFEDNIHFYEKIDVLVRRGKETEVVPSLGLIVACLAKEPEFYSRLPEELKDYILPYSPSEYEEDNPLLDSHKKIKQIIFMPIDKTKVDMRYLEKLDKANKELEGMV